MASISYRIQWWMDDGYASTMMLGFLQVDSMDVDEMADKKAMKMADKMIHQSRLKE